MHSTELDHSTAVIPLDEDLNYDIEEYCIPEPSSPPKQVCAAAGAETHTQATAIPKPQYGEWYPGVAGSTHYQENIRFEIWKGEEEHEWGPFKNQEEWDLARWLAKHVGQGAIDKFLKLEFVSSFFARPFSSF